MGKCFPFSAAVFMARLRPALIQSGEAPATIADWTSHCFRRGSAADMLEANGVNAMLRHGEWSSPQAAEPYASRDEQQASSIAVASWAIDASDDDS